MPEAYFQNEIDDILAAMACSYKANQQNLLLEIIAKGSPEFNLYNTIDNWNGGTYTHTITFRIPEELYERIYNNIDKLQESLCYDINKNNHLENESIDKVYIRLNQSDKENWKRNSGFLISTSVPLEKQGKLWGDVENYKVFISHKVEDKLHASELKKKLIDIGISCFVAHEDIKPTSDWLEEILSALFSADALIALITDKFYESQWTDQEIGCAIGRNIPIYACRLGNDPHGFIGRFQAISSSWEKLHEHLVPYLLKESKMKNAIIHSTKSFDHYASGKFLIDSLRQIQNYDELEIDQLVQNYNNSAYMRNCYALKQGQFISFINQKSKRQFATDKNGMIILNLSGNNNGIYSM